MLGYITDYIVYYTNDAVEATSENWRYRLINKWHFTIKFSSWFVLLRKFIRTFHACGQLDHSNFVKQLRSYLRLKRCLHDLEIDVNLKHIWIFSRCSGRSSVFALLNVINKCLIESVWFKNKPNKFSINSMMDIFTILTSFAPRQDDRTAVNSSLADWMKIKREFILPETSADSWHVSHFTSAQLGGGPQWCFISPQKLKLNFLWWYTHIPSKEYQGASGRVQSSWGNRTGTESIFWVIVKSRNEIILTYICVRSSFISPYDHFYLISPLIAVYFCFHSILFLFITFWSILST